MSPLLSYNWNNPLVNVTLIWTNLDNCILFCILSLTMGCWQYKGVDCNVDWWWHTPDGSPSITVNLWSGLRSSEHGGWWLTWEEVWQWVTSCKQSEVIDFLRLLYVKHKFQGIPGFPRCCDLRKMPDLLLGFPRRCWNIKRYTKISTCLKLSHSYCLMFNCFV